MSKKMGDLLPEQMTDCLECEILSVSRGVTGKCAFHGVHGGHHLQLLAFKEDDGTWSNRYYCNDCREWAWVRKEQ